MAWCSVKKEAQAQLFTFTLANVKRITEQLSVTLMSNTGK
jgi:hypothetical protein